MSTASDRELDELFADVVASVDEDLRVDAGCPDLAAAVALAHRIDPDAVPRSAVDEVAAWAPVVTMREGRRRRATRDDPELFALLSDVRAQVEQEVVDRLAGQRAVVAAVEPRVAAEEGEASHPGAEIVAVAPRRVWALVLAAAAALVLVAAGVITGVLVTRDEAQALPQSAVHHEPPAEGERSAIRDAEGDRRPSARVPERATVPENATELATDATDAAVEPVPFIETAADAERPAATRRRSRAGPAMPELSLDELDRRAHAAWKAGDLARAEAAFREIVQRAGRTGAERRLADLAYGDLFTLARQADAPAREAALWREYLKAFPRGRFADDARAGLCRRAEGEARTQCWTAYLDAMPEGSHRAQAERELRPR